MMWVKLCKYIDMQTCTEDESADVAVGTQGGDSSLFLINLFINLFIYCNC